MIVSENILEAVSGNVGCHEVNSDLVHLWPQMPPMPPPGQPLIVRLAKGRSRKEARKEAREVLRKVLSSWSGLPADTLPLEETSHGPSWTGKFCGHALDISLSYCPGEAWIGLMIDGKIGIDIMFIEEIPELADLVRTYLDPDAASLILNAHRPSFAFASAWTEREARLKCLKKGLVEWSPEQGELERKCVCRKLTVSDNLICSIATN